VFKKFRFICLVHRYSRLIVYDALYSTLVALLFGICMWKSVLFFQKMCKNSVLIKVFRCYQAALQYYIYRDRVAWSVVMSVTVVSPAIMAEMIKMLFELIGGPCIRWGAHWRHLANTIEAPMCGGDAAFLSDYFDHLLVFPVPHGNY